VVPGWEYLWDPGLQPAATNRVGSGSRCLEVVRGWRMWTSGMADAGPRSRPIDIDTFHPVARFGSIEVTPRRPSHRRPCRDEFDRVATLGWCSSTSRNGARSR